MSDKVFEDALNAYAEILTSCGPTSDVDAIAVRLIECEKRFDAVAAAHRAAIAAAVAEERRYSKALEGMIRDVLTVRDAYGFDTSEPTALAVHLLDMAFVKAAAIRGGE